MSHRRSAWHVLPVRALAIAIVLGTTLAAFPTLGMPTVPASGHVGVPAVGIPTPAFGSATHPGPLPTDESSNLSRALAWSEVTAPPTGFGFSGGLVANASSGIAIAFGGESSGVLQNGTYAYSEATDTWSTLTPGPSPAPRSDFAFASDATTGTAVLFGGRTNLTSEAVSNDTWTFNLASERWSPVTTARAPPAREDAAFAIDPTSGIAVLYGGVNANYSRVGALTYSDLWEFNLSTGVWTNVSVPGLRPPPLEGATMTWDPSMGTVDMFGGCYPCSSAVWQFDPGTLEWTELAVAGSVPAARAAASWTYDPVMGADLLFGGTNGATSFNDTRLFFPSNATWVTEALPPAPPARSGAASAFLDVPANQTWLLAGGTSGSTVYPDLWRLSATANLSLRVVNASSPLQGVSGALVNISGRPVGSTDPVGYLNLTQVNVVATAVEVRDVPWYIGENFTLWEPPGEAGNITVALVPEPPGTVNLHVTSNSGPLSGALALLRVDGVLVNETPVVTNGSGDASFYGAPPGRLNVAVSATQWRSASGSGVLAAGGVTNVTVTLVPDPVISVQVGGSLPDGEVVALINVPVYVNNSEIGVTNSKGVVVGTTNAFGATSVGALAPGFILNIETVLVPKTGTLNVSLVLTSLPFGFLPVEVRRSTDGFPILGAAVQAVTAVNLAFGPYSERNATISDGTTGLTLPEGYYVVNATAVNYFASAASYVTVEPGPNALLTLYLVPVPPANLHVVVHSQADGAPVAGANVTLEPVNLVGHANLAGYYNATNLTPGDYTVLVSAPGFEPNSTLVGLFSLENRTLLVNLTPLPLVSVTGGWAFNLFPGSLEQLWPFLLAPLLLIVGSFLFASVLRGSRDEDPLLGASSRSALTVGVPGPGPPPAGPVPPPPS